MSSILKALKKLETETNEKETKQFVWPQPVDTKATFNSKLQDKFSKKFLTYKVALGFFCSTTLILLLIISYSVYNKSIGEQNLSAGSEEKSTELAINSTPGTEKKIKEDVASGGKDMGVDKNNIDEAEAQLSDELPKENAEVALSEVPPSPEEAMKENQMTEAVYAVPEKRTAPGWLTLQGISWSVTPSKRMAVINSTIAREGKTVEGGRIVRIDKTYVVVEKNGESLMLTFD